MKKMFKTLFTLAIALTFAIGAMAQGTLKGKVVSASDNEALPGANIILKGTSNGTTTAADGTFQLDVNKQNGIIIISFIGYESKSLIFDVTKPDLGTITLESDAMSLEDIVVIGSGVIDLSEDRITPIASTTIPKIEIQEKAGNWDLPEILKSTPSVQNVKGGGFGDGAMYLRGFDQTNTAFLLNGQPINGMEDGKMYWSNWSGVLDIASAVQVQRGLGSSKLAISSVGGTVNLVTKTVDMKKGGFIQGMAGNDNYIKSTGYYSTGLMENGFAVSAMFGHWQGNGYMDAAKGQGQTYFLSLGYKPNDNNIFNFLITGAPQWHGAAGGDKISDYLDHGRRYNSWMGYYNGETYPGGRNYYHKPVINLSWDWTINNNTTLSTVAYASFGRGGFAYPQGRTFYSFSTEDGYIDYDAIEANNATNADADNFIKSSVNSHNWYGVISNLKYEFSENLSFNVGFDARSYHGIHFRTAADLMGATPEITSTYNGTYSLTESTGYNPWKNFFMLADRKQHFSYDYEEAINYLGAFGQVEYSLNNFSAFLQGAVSTQSHLKTDFWNYSTAKDAEKVTNPGFNLKTGASYNINENNIVFVNAGYYSRQPFHDDLFVNIRASNELNPFGNMNQKITGLEAGYKFKSEYVSANLNLYHTIWDNRILSSAKDTDNNGESDVFYQSSGIKEVHQGIELEVFARPMDNLKVNGFASIGDWTYNGNVETRSYDLNDVLLSEGDIAYIDGVKIGNAAQVTGGINAAYKIIKNLSIDATLNYFNNLYASIDLGASEYETANNRGSIKLPGYETVDMGVSYKIPVGDKKQNIQFRLNVNNILDKFYIENSSTNFFAEEGDETWEGINVNNKVDLGYGTTWNFSIRFNF